VFRRVTFLFFVFVFVFIVGIPILDARCSMLDTRPNQSKEQGARNRGSAYGTWVGGPEL
jgi:hypothetical protein